MKKAKSRYYNLQSILGNDWAMFYVLVGARCVGKSYSVSDYLCRQKKKLGDNCKNYWMRISETSTKALLSNKANKLVDPDLVRKYKLDLSTKGMTVYNRDKVFMEVMPLVQMGKLKGQAFFDKDYTGWYNIVLDEFQLEQGETRTSFDILYNFIGMIENIVRTNKTHIRVFLLGNTLEEASTILKAFSFIPEGEGRFYLKRKRCIVDNIPITEDYIKDRKGSAADILGGGSQSNFTNKLSKDIEIIDKSRCKHAHLIIKFSKNHGDWYTLWDNGIIKRWNHDNCNAYIAMRPYLNGIYDKEAKQSVIERFDARGYKFNSLVTLAYFTDALSKIRK